MGSYCITMEKTLRTAMWFDADSDEEAMDIASDIFNKTADSDLFEFCDVEYDYSVCDDSGRDIVEWDR